MNGKKTKILCAVIAVLVVLIGIMTGLLLVQKKENPSGSSIRETASVENTTENAAGVSEETEKTDADDSDRKTNLYYAEITEGAAWENGGNQCATENVTIYNQDQKAVTSWKLDIIYASDPTVDQIWEGACEVKGNTVTITPVEYNAEIPAGGSLTFGFNLSAADKKVTDYKLYINGTEYTGSEASSETADAASTTTETESIAPPSAESGTPFENHGALSVSGTDLVDSKGNPYQLKGCSTHGITWFPDYVNEDAFRTFRDDWGANLIRLAMYTDTGDSYGYCSGGNKEEIEALVDQGVQAATGLGMYVIIDWHILSDNNPNTHIEDAKVFFAEMTKKYANYENVLYEICNEPNSGTSWSEVKAYAETIIPVIRENDEDAIIIVGTPTWCQDVDIVSGDPITGYDNIMYAVHFYAATHKEDLRNKVTTAISNGLPLIVSEFSICDASGNGAIDYAQADAWFELINEKNLSFASWSISNKAETASLLTPSCTKTSGWTEEDLSETGIYIRDRILGK